MSQSKRYTNYWPCDCVRHVGGAYRYQRKYNSVVLRRCRRCEAVRPDQYDDHPLVMYYRFMDLRATAREISKLIARKFPRGVNFNGSKKRGMAEVYADMETFWRAHGQPVIDETIFAALVTEFGLRSHESAT